MARPATYGTLEQVLEIYAGVWGAAADAEGADYWVNLIDNGDEDGSEWTYVDVADSFFDQPRVQDVYEDGSGNPLAGDAFLAALYKNIFKVATPDFAGFVYWQGIMADMGITDYNSEGVGNLVMQMIDGMWANPLTVNTTQMLYQNWITASVAFYDYQVENDLTPFSQLSPADQSSFLTAASALLNDIDENTTPEQIAASVEEAASMVDPNFAATYTLEAFLALDPQPDNYRLDADTVYNVEDAAIADALDAYAAVESAIAGARNSAALELAAIFTWSLADTLENLSAEAAADVLAGASAYSLTNEAGSLGLLTSEQMAIVDGADNAEDFTYVTFALTAAANSVNEGNSLAFTVTASEVIDQDVKVTFTLIPGDTAAPNQGSTTTNLNDFAGGAFNPVSVTIPAGSNTATFNVTPLNDGLTELGETFSVQAVVAGNTFTQQGTVLDGTSGQTFTLKIGEDRLTGTAGNDTFNAPALEQQGGGVADSLENIDILDGGAGVDTLNATVNAGVPVTPSLSNIENVELRVTTAGGAIDFAASTGVQSVTIQNSTAATGSIDNLANIGTLAIKNQAQDVTFDKSTAATLALALDTFGRNVNGVITTNNLDLGATAAAKASTLNATVNNAYATIDSTFADTIRTVTIAATGANQLSFVDSGATIKSATITGTGSVDLSPTALTGALATFNASAASGNIKADIQSTVLATVTTGGGNDWIDMGTAVLAGTTANLGAGNDTLLVGALLGNFAKADGGEGTDTINITNGATLTAANSKLISNFEVLDASGGTGNYDVSLNNFATVQIDEAVNGALAGAVNFTNAGDSFTLNVASEAGTNANFAVANPITVTGKDYTGTTATGDAETFTLVANMRDGNKNDTANGNINANTVTVAGVEHLVVESNVSVLDGGSKALGAGEHTLTVTFVAAEAETITVKGAASVDLSGATTIGAVTKVDATQSTGNVTVDLSGHTKSVAYFGSEGVDVYTASANGDNIYTGKGADIVTLNAAARDTFVLKAATDSQLGDTDKSGKITLAGDELKAGVPQIDTITNFSVGGGATDDRLDVTNFGFTGAQRGVVDVSASVTNTTDLTSIADLFAAPAGDRGLAYSTIAGDTYVFVDANKDGNFTAADDMVLKLVGVAGLSEVDVNF